MSDDQTARLALPYLAAGQMQKHVTLNEGLTRLDALIQTAVVSRTTTTQPGVPEDGALWILPSGATGVDWSTRSAGALMRAEGGGWTAVAVVDGLIALVLDAGELLVWQAGTWVDLGARLGVAQALSRLGLGTTADSANPFAARLNAALWTALEAGSGGSGDLRLTLNKETSGDVLSLMFQSGYGGRAELGLLGDDDLRLKVSDDGGSWHEVFAVDRASGRTTFERGAGRRAVTILTSDGSYTVPTWARSIEAILVGGGGGGGGGDSGASGSRFGGGGGSGGVSRGEWPADLLGATLTVEVGSGGAGGAAAAGSVGGDSALHMGGTTLLVAAGGGGGLGGSAGGEAGMTGPGCPHSNAGGASNVTATGAPGRSFDRPDAPGGGGAGGGLDGTDAVRAGGTGGDGGSLAVKAPGGTGGTGSAGSAGAPAPEPLLHWAGGGGGGGGAAAFGAGHDGADGGSAGGGGGGGGAGIAAGGTGGDGGNGTVWLVAIG